MDAYKKLSYEFQGIKSVITDYTDSGHVLNFLNGLEQGINNKDKEKIKYFLSEILTWYGENLTKISDSRYVRNFNEHKRNMDIIYEVLKGIDNSDFSKENQNITMVNNLTEPVIFLSHSSTDKKYADALEKLFSSIGIKNEQLIYTSHPLHKIPLDKNIYEYLREQFGKKIFAIILWSNEYLESPACLNEMGAVWVTQSNYSNIYVPSFDFQNPKYYKCAVDKNKMWAILNGNEQCKISMVELKNTLAELFGLNIDEKQWTYSIEQFVKDIK